MPTLRVAIDGRGAKQGSTVFVKETERITDSAGKAKAAIAGIFSALLAGGIVYKVVREFGALEEKLRQIQGVTNATEQEMARLAAASRKLGRDTQFTAAQAADGLLTISKAGFSVSQSVGIVNQVLNLATAQMLDLTQSSEIVTSTMRLFGLQTSEASRVVDSLSSTANASSVDVTDLAASLKFTGAIANTIGLSLEEVNAALGILGDNMVKGAVAGTNLRGIFSALVRPTSIASKEIQRLGLSIEDLNPQTNSLKDIFIRLRDAGMDVESALRIFNIRNATAAVILAANIEKYDGFVAAQERARGSTAKLAEEMTKTIPGTFLRLQSAISEVILQLGEKWEDAIRSALEASIEFVNALGGMENRFSTLAKLTVGFATVALVGTLVPALWTATTAIGAFSVALLANPFGAAAVGIGAVIAALIAFRGELVTVNSQVVRVGDLVGASWEFIRDATVQLGQDIGGVFKNTFEWVTRIVKTTVNTNITLLLWMGEVAKAVAKSLTVPIQAFAALDFSSFDAFKKSIASAGIAAYNAGQSVGNDFLKGLEESKGRDYVGEMAQDFGEMAAYGLEMLGGTGIWQRAREKFIAREGPQLMDAIKRIMFPFLGAVAEPTKAIVDLGDAFEETEDISSRYLQQLHDLIAGYRLEADTMGLSRNEQELRSRLMEAENIIREGQIENGEEYLALLEQEIRLVQRLRAEQWHREFIDNLKDERYLLGFTNEEREVRQALLEAERVLIEGNVENAEEMLAVLEAEIRLTQKLRDLRNLANDVGTAFAGAFEEMVLGAKNAEEAMKALAVQVYRLIFSEIVSKPIAQAVSGAFYNLFGGILTPQAKGGVWDNGSLQPFANGGSLYRKPSIVPMANGNSALIGEAGPEAVLPLERDASGKLGVRANMGEGVRPIQVTINVNAKDVDSFRRSKGQIATEMQRALSSSAGRQ